MDNPDNKRLHLAKLNAIEGVEITTDQFDPRLSFDLLLLRGERLDGFLAAFG